MLHDLLERGPLDVLHRQEPNLVLFPEVVHAGDVGMRDPSSESYLGDEAILRVFIVQREELERYHLVELQVPDPIDRSHAAAAEQGLDLVAIGKAVPRV